MQVNSFYSYAGQAPSTARKQPVSAQPMFGMTVAEGGSLYDFAPPLTLNAEKVRKNNEQIKAIINNLKRASKPQAFDVATLPASLQNAIRMAPEDFRALKRPDGKPVIIEKQEYQYILSFNTPQGWVRVTVTKIDNTRPRLSIGPLDSEMPSYRTSLNLRVNLSDRPSWWRAPGLNRETYKVAGEMLKLAEKLFEKGKPLDR